MKLNRHAFMLVTGAIILTSATFVPAPMVGLPIMDTADRHDPGQIELMPGAAFGKDMDFAGVRAGYSFIDELRGFVDVGRLHTEHLGDNLSIQAGGLYSLPMFDFCETGIRAAGYYVNTDSMDMIGGNLMVLGSGESLLDDLFLYGGFGVDGSERKVYTTHSEINPALAGGLCYRFTKTWSLFMEGDYVDGFYVAGGLSIKP